MKLSRCLPVFIFLIIVLSFFSCSWSLPETKEADPPGTSGGGSDPAANQSPTALFSAVNTALTGTAITFSADNSSDSDGTISSFSWDFGDTGTSSEQNPTYTYASSGTYQVTLTVTDDDGATNAATMSIIVKDGLIAVAGDDINAYKNDLVTLNGVLSQTASGTITDYSWDFGDGLTGSGETVVHRYSTSGTYTVSLTVTNDSSQTDTGTLMVTVSVPENFPPIASISGAGSVVINEEITYIANASMDPDGTIDSYAWDFGDGSAVVSTSIAAHTFTVPGTYTVSLTVTDNGGLTDVQTKKVVVEGLPNQAPVADAGGDRTITVGDSISFDGTLCSDPDGTIVSYLWDFGDGTTSTEVSPTKVFDVAGVYNIELEITDSHDNNASTDITITVLNTNDAVPVVNAGDDIDVTVNYGDTRIVVPLNGSVTSDFTVDSAVWHDLSTFQSMSYYLEDSLQATTNLVLEEFDTFWQQAEFDDYFLIRLQLQVTDQNGNTGHDEILIRVNVYSRLQIIGY